MTNKQDYGILTKSIIYCFDKIMSIIDDSKSKDQEELLNKYNIDFVYLNYEVEYGKRYNCSKSISYHFESSSKNRELYIFVLYKRKRIEIISKRKLCGYSNSVISIKKIIHMNCLNDLYEFYKFLLHLSNDPFGLGFLPVNYIFYEFENYILGKEIGLLNDYLDKYKEDFGWMESLL